MELKVLQNVVTISGNIKTINDFQNIKKSIDALILNSNDIVINIVDSISITSSVIGYFNKLILKDKINIKMSVGNRQLLDLFEDLNLTSLFNIN